MLLAPRERPYSAESCARTSRLDLNFRMMNRCYYEDIVAIFDNFKPILQVNIWNYSLFSLKYKKSRIKYLFVEIRVWIHFFESSKFQSSQSFWLLLRKKLILFGTTLLLPLTYFDVHWRFTWRTQIFIRKRTLSSRLVVVCWQASDRSNSPRLREFSGKLSGVDFNVKIQNFKMNESKIKIKSILVCSNQINQTVPKWKNVLRCDRRPSG